MCAAIQESISSKEIVGFPLMASSPETIIKRALANQCYLSLFQYVWGGNLDHALKFPKVEEEEKKARWSLQRLIFFSEDRPWQELFKSIEAARARVLGHNLEGTADVVCNTLVGRILFGISDIELFHYAALHGCGHRAPQEQVSEEGPLYLDAKFPSVKVDSILIDYTFEQDGKSVFVKPESAMPVLIETYDEENVPDLAEAIENAARETLEEKLPQIQALIAQKKHGKPCAEQIAGIFKYTVAHIVCADGKVSNGKLEPMRLFYFSPRDREGKVGVYLEQNLERICREAFSCLQKPVAEARLCEIENILTLIPVRAEQEWRLCFPKETTSAVSFTFAIPINNILWVANVGDCKTFAVLEHSIQLLSDNTCSKTHAVGARRLPGASPRAKVTTFCDKYPQNRLRAIVQGTRYLTADIVQDSFENDPSLESLRRRYSSPTDLDFLQCKVVKGIF